MGEFASKGTAGAGLGLGIAGTALGLVNGGWLGNGVGLGNWNGRNAGCGWGGWSSNMDINVSEALAARDAQIARLEAKAYSDESNIAVYKYFDARIREVEERIHQNELAQCKINSTVNASIAAFSGQLVDAQTTLANITKTAIPRSAICDFNNGCNCGTNNL